MLMSAGLVSSSLASPAGLPSLFLYASRESVVDINCCLGMLSHFAARVINSLCIRLLMLWALFFDANLLGRSTLVPSRTLAALVGLCLSRFVASADRPSYAARCFSPSQARSNYCVHVENPCMLLGLWCWIVGLRWCTLLISAVPRLLVHQPSQQCYFDISLLLGRILPLQSCLSRVLVVSVQFWCYYFSEKSIVLSVSNSY